jgi:regulatory protein
VIQMEITSMEKDNKNNGLIKVYVNGEYSFSISEEEYFKRGFYEKEEVTREEIEDIKTAFNFKNAKETALKYMTLKLRCSNEVKQKLLTTGYSEVIVDNVISDLISLGYINDRIFIRKYLYDRSKLKPKSKKLLKYELLKKGLAENLVDDVLNEWQIDEPTLARRLVKKKYGKYDLRDEKILRKIYNFLLHRGFSVEIINDIIKKID